MCLHFPLVLKKEEEEEEEERRKKNLTLCGPERIKEEARPSIGG
jgi:hypothetical protein